MILADIVKGALGMTGLRGYTIVLGKLTLSLVVLSLFLPTLITYFKMIYNDIDILFC